MRKRGLDLRSVAAAIIACGTLCLTTSVSEAALFEGGILGKIFGGCQSSCCEEEPACPEPEPCCEEVVVCPEPEPECECVCAPVACCAPVVETPCCEMPVEVTPTEEAPTVAPEPTEAPAEPTSSAQRKSGRVRFVTYRPGYRTR